MQHLFFPLFDFDWLRHLLLLSEQLRCHKVSDSAPRGGLSPGITTRTDQNGFRPRKINVTTRNVVVPPEHQLTNGILSDFNGNWSWHSSSAKHLHNPRPLRWSRPRNLRYVSFSHRRMPPTLLSQTTLTPQPKDAKWPCYAGPEPINLTPTGHLENYKAQFAIAKTLEPFKINAHSGEHGVFNEAQNWGITLTTTTVMDGQSTRLLNSSRAPSMPNSDCKAWWATKCIETGHSFSPYATAAVLKWVPSLYVTADFSHFVVVCERLLDQDEVDKELLRPFIPRVSFPFT